MSNKIATKADEIRLQILKMSDLDLVNYGHAIYTENFESIPERIERVAKEHVNSMPF